MARAVSSAAAAGSHAPGFSALPQARIRTLLLLLLHAFGPLSRAIPVPQSIVRGLGDAGPKDPADARLWVYLGTAVALVVAGGAFAGLTIALMGQDEIYLQVIATSGEGRERKNAAKVLQLLKKGKHWVLVTLLLSNVITNETLPIVLDRSLGGGWPAVLSSTVLIVIFGEIVPQSICVRYGLPIGAWMAPVVLGLMWIMAPVAWPTAKLLDYLLGEDHGTTYKKAGLKTLVTLHKTLGTSADDRLNEDEVTIITAVLDLKAKPVGSIMTPMKDVFTMSTDTVLDEQMMDKILSAGYSRIPIHVPNNPRNFVGMLLVKMLITYDPEDALRVRDFSLATLPETRPETSCLDIINFFQEGKSHMVLVSEFPGEDHGAVGVVTLEDVIEELIGEEIIDESDVFIDVHKAIRRLAPAPRTRVPKGEIVTGSSRPSEQSLLRKVDGAEQNGEGTRKFSAPELASNPKRSHFLLQRRSSGNADQAIQLDPEIKQHLKHLGPSNAASKPKSTRINTVKIKPGNNSDVPDGPSSPREEIVHSAPAHQGGAGEGILENAGHGASDAVHNLAVGYGTMRVRVSSSPKSVRSQHKPVEDEAISPRSHATADEHTRLLGEDATAGRTRRSASISTIGSLPSVRSSSHSPSKRRHTARSGSISESVVDINGVRKIVLETTSSSDSEERPHTGNPSADDWQVHILKQEVENDDQNERINSAGGSSNKKKRKKRGKKKKGPSSAGSGESKPLLGGQ
ncbi:DUF21-domain-containing protein [Westerdykella ornata]|uniref:DUF21-domain-containing protein n=1 Tax=Westerdykella ornata TaxID=318751 RepID=A0A6A6JR24_WESOR|nr:DUF21-domain-containing protein [Westerdykella ornata]KAF2279081.1 DUF21-domain-containing protein [Westerdykella ornata]